MSKSWRIRNIDDFAAVINEFEDHCKERLDSGGEYVIEVKKAVNQRTVTQNASLHKYCSVQAQKLADAGFTQRKLWEVLKQGFDLPPTMHHVKDIFRSVGKSMFRKESTKDLTTVEIQEVHRAVDQGFAETTQVTTPWPSKDSMMWGD